MTSGPDSGARRHAADSRTAAAQENAEPIWRPDHDLVADSVIARFTAYLSRRHGGRTEDWDPAGEMRRVVESVVQSVFGSEPPASLVIEVREGGTAKVLLEAGAAATMLVVGSRGHGGFGGLLLGSVSANGPIHVMDGDDILISTTRARAKAKAVQRNPKASLCVLDENWPPTYITVFCNAYIDATVDDDLDAVVDVRATDRWPDGRART